MTTQAQIKEILCGVSLPYREIKCYGSQITVECMSQDTCLKWGEVISKFAKVRGIIKSLAYAQKNTKTLGNPAMFEVYRLYARII
jgi:hypothetical protein